MTHHIALPDELRAKINSNLVNWRCAQGYETPPEKRIPSYPVFVDRLFKELHLIDSVKLSEVLDAIEQMEVSGVGAKEFLISKLRQRFTANDNPNWSMMHAAIGAAGEGGELLDAVKKVCIYGKDWNVPDKDGRTPLEGVIEELADLKFYVRKIMNILGITDEEIDACNHAKLDKRYTSGTYSDAQAQGRADKDKGEALAVASPAPAPVAAVPAVIPLGERVPTRVPSEPRKFMGQANGADVVREMAADRADAEKHRKSWDGYRADLLQTLGAQFEALPIERQKLLLDGSFVVELNIARKGS